MGTYDNSTGGALSPNYGPDSICGVCGDVPGEGCDCDLCIICSEDDDADTLATHVGLDQYGVSVLLCDAHKSRYYDAEPIPDHDADGKGHATDD